MNFNPAGILRDNLMQSKIMEWTNDDALELIEQYRTHTELWNRADPKYKDKLCRFRAWSEIAERFGCSKAEVERKMNVLLTQYRREKHKMLVKLYQGIQPNPSKWYAFKRFDFMEAGGGTSVGLGVGVGVGVSIGVGSGIGNNSSGSGNGNTSGIVSIMHQHHHHGTSSSSGGGLGSSAMGMACGSVSASASGSGSNSSGAIANGLFYNHSNNNNNNNNNNNDSNSNSSLINMKNITTNGHHSQHAHQHQHHHHHHHAHLRPHHHHHHQQQQQQKQHYNSGAMGAATATATAAAAAAAAALNGLAVANYESAAKAAGSVMPITTSYHRRMKSKEMKYFGAMGLNMLLANSQPTLDNWNVLGQYSPPPPRPPSLSERHHPLRVPLTMPFAASQHPDGIGGGGGGAGGGGGGDGSRMLTTTTQSLFSGASTSSNHSEEDSSQKPMDTGEIDSVDDKLHLDARETKCESTVATTIETVIATTATPTATSPTTAEIESKPLSLINERQLVQQPAHTIHLHDSNHSTTTTTPTTITAAPAATASASATVAAVTTTAVTERGLLGVMAVDTSDRLLSDSRSGTLNCTNNINNSSSPIPNTNMHEAHKQHAQHFQKHLFSSSNNNLMANCMMKTLSRNPNDIDIKQELLVDYFHAPHPPAPPDSQRSYSSPDDNRHSTDITDEYAQDLRVSAAAAAAAAAAKTLDFTRFVLPTGLNSSNDLLEEKFSPLNMRKLNSGASTASSTAAGHMLINSLLSNESTSDDNNASIKGHRKSSNASNGQVTQDAASSAAAATAAAIYAESLHKDDCDYIGSNVSVKLRAMDRTQRIIAEKLISEVLFYGQFNELERSARIQPK